ncbi:MAG: Nif3-like dinuclear metal center hexameric protein [Kiritimatiellae bacterium]|nr:Nif3-like dinuclear metal center hexameric protein [Kiritimatiellia bacterium]
MTTIELAEFLNKTLEVEKFKDVSNNGLQVANNGTLTRVLCGVDANLKLLREAKERGADCIVCHHGISWGDSLKHITGLNYELVALAIKSNIAIYGVHLPLDAHPVYGNNAQICKALQLVELDPGFDYHGQNIGYTAELTEALTFEQICTEVTDKISNSFSALNFGSASIRKIGVVSGGAADLAGQAQELGVDLFITGEPSLLGYNLAEQLRINVIFAGHYATEIFGVRALSEVISQELGIPAECVDYKTPF